MRMMGTPAEIIAWQPPDWPPLYNLLLGAWSTLAGEFPFSLRIFSTFLSLLSVCLAYQMAYTLTKDRRIAWGTLIVYAGLGMSVYLGIFMRGYIIGLLLLPLAILLTARYFSAHRKRDMVGLALTLGLLFITTYTSFFAFVFLGLLTLMLNPRQTWRWIPVGVIASPFAIIEIGRKWDYWVNRLNSSNLNQSGYGYQLDFVFIEQFQDFFGQAELFWLVLIILSCALVITKSRHHFRLFLWVVIGCILAPVITFWLVESRIYVLLTSRYSWWALIVLAFGLGLGLRHLPNIIWHSTMIVILALMLTIAVPIRYFDESPHGYHYENNMEWLSTHSQVGDLFIFDPNTCIQECNDQDTLTYLWDTYLGEKVRQIDEIEPARRIWVWRGNEYSRDLKEQLSEISVASEFYGPPIALLQLYELPPDAEGILFDNGMRFHGFDILSEEGFFDTPPYNFREQESLHIRLWWSTDRPLNEDYQVSIQIQDKQAHTILTQDDNAPHLIHLKPNEFKPLPQRTSEWIPNQLYVEERILHFPDINREIESQINLIVYRLSDQKRITTSENDLVPLTDTIVWGWG